MSGFEDFYTSSKGVKHEWCDNNDGTYSIRSSQDLEETLDYNKAAYTHNDGYSLTRELRRAAYLPDIIVLKWLNEEGWNAYDPNCRHKLKQKLNSSEYLYLRTAPGHL